MARGLAGGKRIIEISVNVNRHFKSTSVKHLAVREPRLTKRQREVHAVQQPFYAKYMAAGRRAYAKGRAIRLRGGDRLALLIGELEADVNNGGFAQYLANRGRPRAREALRALAQVGARRTGRLIGESAPDVRRRDYTTVEAATRYSPAATPRTANRATARPIARPSSQSKR